MLLMSSVESQAVLGLLFFSPSAATLCRGTPDPTLWRSGSALRPARARPRARACWGTCRASSDSRSLGARAGPGPGRVRSPGRFALRGFRRQARGEAAAGLPDLGLPGSAHTVLTHPGHSVAESSCPALSAAALTYSRGPVELAGRGGQAASTPSRGSLGALWRRAAAAAPGLGPLSLLRAVCWPGPGPGPSASSPSGAAGRD